jgi:hypothetical protein
MPAAEQFLVHLGAITIKIVHSQILSNYVQSLTLDFGVTLPQAIGYQNFRHSTSAKLLTANLFTWFDAARLSE